MLRRAVRRQHSRHAVVTAMVVVALLAAELSHAQVLPARSDSPHPDSQGGQQSDDQSGGDRVSLAAKQAPEKRPGLGVMTTGQWGCCSPSAGDDQQPWSPNRTKGPQSVGASIHVGGDHSSLSLGVIGTRYYQMPLFTSTLLAGPEIPTPAMSSLTDVSRGAITWQIVGSMTKTVFESKGGKAVGIVGDIFIPMGAQVSADVPHNPALPSRAVRIGLKFGF